MVTSLNNIHFHRHGNSIMHRCVILVEICPIPRENFLHTPTYILEKKNLVISIKSFKRCLKDGYFIDWLISKETHETRNIIHWFVPSSSSELIMVILFSLAYLFFNKLIFGRKSSYSKNDFLRVTMLISAC